MSLSHHLSNAALASLNVSGDINFAYLELDAIKENIKAYKTSPETKFQLIGKIQEDLEKLILVYNENVLKINYGKSLIKEHDFPTFEEWSKSQPFYFHNKTLDEKRADYNNDLDASKSLYWSKLVVNYNLAELARPQLHLRKKIEKLIQRLRVQGIPVEKKLPAFEKLDFTTTDLIHYDQRLREPSSKTIPFDAIPIANPAAPIDSSTQFKVLYLEKQLRRQILSPGQTASSSSSSTTSSTTPASPSVDVAEPVQAPQTRSVTIHCPLAGNETLGICQEPDWGKKPIPFTSNDHQNWKVELPRNLEFKYVIIEAGKDLRWESKPGNRCLRPDSSNSSVPDEAPSF